MNFIITAGIGIAVLIELLLIRKAKKSAADYILTVWMFLIALHLFLTYRIVTDDFQSTTWLLGLDIPLPLLHGVLLYFYVGVLTHQAPRRVIMMLHLIPAAAMYLFLTPFFALPEDQKILIYQEHGAGYETFNIIRSYAYKIFGVAYAAWSAYLLKCHRKNILEQFSNIDAVNLEWLNFLTVGMGVVWLVVIVVGTDVVNLAGIALFVFLIGFFGIRQTEIFLERKTESQELEPKKKYQKSGLSDDAAKSLHKKLLQLMEDEKPYLRNELSINDLAEKLDVHPNYLSQIINQEEKMNFYDFINYRRIEEFKRRIVLPQNRHMTLLSVAFDCGFNSKSSFNRFFKKSVGYTPSQYFSSTKSVAGSERSEDPSDR